MARTLKIIIPYCLLGMLILFGYSGCRLLCKHKRGPFWGDIDLFLYQAVRFEGDRGIGGLNFENVRPGIKTDYFKIFYSNLSDGRLSYAEVGIKCATASNKEDCQTEFDALESSGCVKKTATRSVKIRGMIFEPAYALALTVGNPVSQFGAFIISNHGDTNRVWCTREEDLQFFGTIDSKEEAALLLSNDDFFAYGGKENGAVQEINGQYEFIVSKYVYDYAGEYTINRYLLQVSPSGEVVILREQLAEELRCE